MLQYLEGIRLTCTSFFNLNQRVDLLCMKITEAFLASGFSYFEVN